MWDNGRQIRTTFNVPRAKGEVVSLSGLWKGYRWIDEEVNKSKKDRKEKKDDELIKNKGKSKFEWLKYYGFTLLRTLRYGRYCVESKVVNYMDAG